MDILSELTQLKADYQAAQDLLAANASTVSEKDEALAAATQEIEAKASKVTELEALVSSHAEEIKALKQSIASLEASKQTAEEKAIELVASQGIAPLKVDVAAANEEAISKEQFLATLESLKGDSIKAAEYFHKHKSAFLNA